MKAAMFPKQTVLTFLFLLFLSACSPAPEAMPTQIPTEMPTSVPSSTPLPLATETPIPTSEPTATLVPLSVSEICTPLRDHDIAKLPEYVTKPYSETLTSNKEQGHHGVDFAYLYKDGDGPVIEGVEILSIMDGVVVSFTNNRNPYGNMMMVETPYQLLPPEVIVFYDIKSNQSMYHLYAHLLDNPTLAVGQAVKCGDTLGQVGNTGNSGNPHLHLGDARWSRPDKAFLSSWCFTIRPLRAEQS